MLVLLMQDGGSTHSLRSAIRAEMRAPADAQCCRGVWRKLLQQHRAGAGVAGCC